MKSYSVVECATFRLLELLSSTFISTGYSTKVTVSWTILMRWQILARPRVGIRSLWRDIQACFDYFLLLYTQFHELSHIVTAFTIYHQGFFHSVRRNPSLNCFHRRRSLAILAHAVPRWRTRLSLHLVLGLPCRLVHSRGVHSVTLLVHLLSLKRAMCPAHPCIPFLSLHGHVQPLAHVTELPTATILA